MMHAIARTIPIEEQLGSVRPMPYEDPISDDDFRDVAVVTTARGLCRIAMVAAQAATRFQSENSPHDPMAWMLSPRRLFDGGNALKACLDREPFMRTMLLHGLAIGLDADPEHIDDLFGDSDDTAGFEAAARVDTGREADGMPSLFTATIVHHGDQVMMHAFHASVGTSTGEVAARLRARYGPVIASRAEIVVGFNPMDKFVEALVAPAIGDMLRTVAAEPTSRVAAGLNLNFEQRLDA